MTAPGIVPRHAAALRGQMPPLPGHAAGAASPVLSKRYALRGQMAGGMTAFFQPQPAVHAGRKGPVESERQERAEPERQRETEPERRIEIEAARKTHRHPADAMPRNDAAPNPTGPNPPAASGAASGPIAPSASAPMASAPRPTPQPSHARALRAALVLDQGVMDARRTLELLLGYIHADPVEAASAIEAQLWRIGSGQVVSVATDKQINQLVRVLILRPERFGRLQSAAPHQDLLGQAGRAERMAQSTPGAASRPLFEIDHLRDILRTLADSVQAVDAALRTRDTPSSKDDSP